MQGEQIPDDFPLVVASNRGPVEHHLRPDSQIEVSRASGGLVTALGALRKHVKFSWVASAITAGDRHIARSSTPGHDIRTLGQDRHAGLRAWPQEGSSPLVDFVVVQEDVFKKHYQVFSNRILWFLQHSMWDKLQVARDKRSVSEAWWGGYVPTNQAFARKVGAILKKQKKHVVMLHDYHLYLAPGFIRAQFPDSVLQHFVHIPWPSLEAWEPLPLALCREIYRSLLQNDIIGFQTEVSASNFLRCCDDLLDDANVNYDRKTIRFHGRTVRVRCYPISVDVGALRRMMNSPIAKRHQDRLAGMCGEKTLVRVDRLDPSKNIVLGFRAFARLLDMQPELRGKVRFLAFLVPSRTGIAEYEQYYEDVMSHVDAINGKHGRDGFRPVEVFYENNYHQALAGMSLCDVLLVNPLADGMNLVAKEGPVVSTRDSVLVLSKTAGAHEQLKDGVLSIEPTDVDATALALARALGMPRSERRERASFLRARIEKEDVSNWMTIQLEDVARVLAERSGRTRLQGEYALGPV